VGDNENKYGKRSVNTLATLLGFDKSTLHDYANVAKTWDANEFKALVKRKNGAGLGLRFSHLIVLARVEDGQQRNALVDQVLEQNLTVRQLEEVVRARTAGGDVTADESSASTPAEVIKRVTADWKAAADKIDRGTRALVQLASRERTPKVLDLIRTTAEKQRALAQRASASADELFAALGEAGSPSNAEAGESDSIISVDAGSPANDGPGADETLTPDEAGSPS
jgi:hypothetical protein